MKMTDYLLDRYGPTMDANQTGEITHHHPSHIRALFKSGELPGVKIGGRWIIPTVKLAEILEGGSI